jgi:nucleoid DNA-binding protein
VFSCAKLNGINIQEKLNKKMKIKNDTENLLYKNKSEANLKIQYTSFTKAKLIQLIASDIGFSKRKTSEILSVLLKILATSLAKGDSISIRGFGKFYVSDQKERKIRHPLTGQIILVGPKKVAKFKPFISLREKINDLGFDLDMFKKHNKIILRQLYDLVENSGDYEEEEEETV